MDDAVVTVNGGPGAGIEPGRAPRLTGDNIINSTEKAAGFSVER